MNTDKKAFDFNSSVSIGAPSDFGELSRAVANSLRVFLRALRVFAVAFGVLELRPFAAVAGRSDSGVAVGYT
jgi:hypothetical protein